MTEKTRQQPIGIPPGSREPEDTGDFADEHTDMTVSDDISDHSDYEDIETESPRGVGGMDTPPDPLREV
ncbi:MAG: hypothetical protein IRY92_13495 [Dactylosporangium sp.]|jgi:hypothetical protein|nr:hypothetical protein [Dactylosporangium sp.]